MHRWRLWKSPARLKPICSDTARAGLIDPRIAEHNGQIDKLMGDGMLAEFPNVVDAVQAAVEAEASGS